MSYDLHKVSVRKGLDPRPPPYWGAPLGDGRYLGIRVLKDGTRTWIARLRDEDYNQKFRALGQDTDEFGYTQAVTAAKAWFAERDAGITEEVPTVKKACEEYVAAVREEKGEEAGDQAEYKLEPNVYETPLGRLTLDRITTEALRKWRNGLRKLDGEPASNATKNRLWAGLRAALNHAVTMKRVSADVAVAWRERGKMPKLSEKGKKVRPYLTPEQRQALIDAFSGALANFIEGGVHTGARPGELKNLRVKDFDAKNGLLMIGAHGQRSGDKTGDRAVPLSDAGVAFFLRMVKDKLPSAPLLPNDEGGFYKFGNEWGRPIRETRGDIETDPDAVFYSMRHSWITDAIKQGMSLVDVARITGTSLQMIDENYGHLLAEDARKRLNSIAMLPTKTPTGA